MSKEKWFNLSACSESACDRSEIVKDLKSFCGAQDIDKVVFYEVQYLYSFSLTRVAYSNLSIFKIKIRTEGQRRLWKLNFSSFPYTPNRLVTGGVIQLVRFGYFKSMAPLTQKFPAATS